MKWEVPRLIPQQPAARDTPYPDVDLAFARSPQARERPAWLQGAEWGAVTGVLAFALGPLPMYGWYLWRNWPLLSGEGWRTIVAQMLTYIVVTGALWGGAVGAALYPARARAESSLLRALIGAAAGALGCVPAGVVAAAHFGPMPTPYFGGAEILLATLGTILIAGLRFARLSPQSSSLATLRRVLMPALFISLLLTPLAAFEPSAVTLELSALRALASELGLVVLGALLGAMLGGIGGCWMGLIAAHPDPAMGRSN